MKITIENLQLRYGKFTAIENLRSREAILNGASARK